MTDDPPLHVQVAQALGWTAIQEARHLVRLNFSRPSDGVAVFVGRPPGELIVGYESPPIPRYDLDWSATGPLIERFNLTICPTTGGWNAYGQFQDFVCMSPNGPLEAVCSLILQLHKHGILTEPRDLPPS